ncbi:hypothetical protein ACQKIE_16115 [Luteibacter sp. NPDC031894]|uniref:hypothetical protein n=1 Tax=Luteibacter sp. NPDC031894 TaxID=3390572 RepID=UPI003D048075
MTDPNSTDISDQIERAITRAFDLSDLNNLTKLLELKMAWYNQGGMLPSNPSA